MYVAENTNRPPAAMVVTSVANADSFAIFELRAHCLPRP